MVNFLLASGTRRGGAGLGVSAVVLASLFACRPGEVDSGGSEGEGDGDGDGDAAGDGDGDGDGDASGDGDGDGDASGDGDGDGDGTGDGDGDGDGDAAGDGDGDGDADGAACIGEEVSFDECGEVPEGMKCVPAGEFIRGRNNDGHASPEQVIYLDLFYIDEFEVTNGDYAECVAADGCLPPVDAGQYGCPSDIWGDPEKLDRPVECVDWAMAVNYCEWAGGKRLPTEAEWEKAARGTEGCAFPWGWQTPNCSLANLSEDDIGGGCLVGEPWPVGSAPQGASGYGAMDLSGNVSEWVADWYGENYYDVSPLENPLGPANGTQRGLRGQNFSYSSIPEGCEVWRRASAPPTYVSQNWGFRCAASPE